MIDRLQPRPLQKFEDKFLRGRGNIDRNHAQCGICKSSTFRIPRFQAVHEPLQKFQGLGLLGRRQLIKVFNKRMRCQAVDDHLDDELFIIGIIWFAYQALEASSARGRPG